MNQYKADNFHNQNNWSKLIDQTDREIINLLKQNSRLQWQEIGERVHLTGQAVANRVRRLEQIGVIKGFTVSVDESIHGKHLEAFVTVFMKTTDHSRFQKFIGKHSLIEEAHRVSGEGCYLLKVQANDHAELTNFLDEILEFGNYRVNLSIKKITEKLISLSPFNDDKPPET
ncbi:transcriptional regulator [Desulfosporosinus acidiphilus SJ4]|uniref:Transcriptional regulator n=1 Tax=Desulfosporosinus acidiphilus (strain DSM 22704 / JCM 16185 / SJ4) TaxID=646529 RepID=I4D5R0_DESAJ|nr:Lrp/AsnC family transcriptional regulator [Desulfosporosinus acidiphilus]AFM41134.1 transcriptional regulator [Desulfosporosinus acidiphilus SJ4]